MTGNPYHDAKGKFSTGSGAHANARQAEIVGGVSVGKMAMKNVQHRRVVEKQMKKNVLNGRPYTARFGKTTGLNTVGGPGTVRERLAIRDAVGAMSKMKPFS
jgi:hypothetical protein